MISLFGCMIWRIFAYNKPTVHKPFAFRVESGNLFPVAGPSSKTYRHNCQNRYPSPSLWPDPFGVRPFFYPNLPTRFRQCFAQEILWLLDNFDRLRGKADICLITKLKRGRAKSCGFLNLQRFSRLLRRYRDVWITTLNVVSWVQARVYSSQKPPEATPLWAGLSVQVQASFVTTWASVAKRHPFHNKTQLSKAHRNIAFRWAFS